MQRRASLMPRRARASAARESIRWRTNSVSSCEWNASTSARAVALRRPWGSQWGAPAAAPVVSIFISSCRRHGDARGWCRGMPDSISPKPQTKAGPKIRLPHIHPRHTVAGPPVVVASGIVLVRQAPLPAHIAGPGTPNLQSLTPLTWRAASNERRQNALRSA